MQTIMSLRTDRKCNKLSNSSSINLCYKLIICEFSPEHQFCSIDRMFVDLKNMPSSGADPGFLERGFICITVCGGSSIC